MKHAKHPFGLTKQLIQLKAFKITEIAQIHMIAFWITLALSTAFTISLFFLFP